MPLSIEIIKTGTPETGVQFPHVSPCSTGFHLLRVHANRCIRLLFAPGLIHDYAVIIKGTRSFVFNDIEFPVTERRYSEFVDYPPVLEPIASAVITGVSAGRVFIRGSITANQVNP